MTATRGVHHPIGSPEQSTGESMAADPTTAAPTSDRLRRWDRAFNPIVVVAAILPLGLPIAGDDPTEEGEGPGAPGTT